jgi:hypothetical protein
MATAFGAPDHEKRVMSIETCVEGIKGAQVAAIVEKYIKDIPRNGILT